MNEWQGREPQKIPGLSDVVIPLFDSEEVPQLFDSEDVPRPWVTNTGKSPEEVIAQWIADAGKVDLQTLIGFLVDNDSVAAVLAYNYVREHPGE